MTRAPSLPGTDSPPLLVACGPFFTLADPVNGEGGCTVYGTHPGGGTMVIAVCSCPEYAEAVARVLNATA